MLISLFLFYFQWKIFLRKKLSVYKNTDQQEFALEKVLVCRILKITFIHFPYQLSKICIDVSAKNKVAFHGNIFYVDDNCYYPCHFYSPVLIYQYAWDTIPPECYLTVLFCLQNMREQL